MPLLIVAGSIAVCVTLWLTVVPAPGQRGTQLALGAAATLGALLSHRWPGFGALLAACATATAWFLGLTADPFLLAGVGVFASAERQGGRRFPAGLFALGGVLGCALLILGTAPGDPGFDARMRGIALGAVVLAVAWVLGVRTRELRGASAATARNEERLRLARDVHDALSHSLGAIGVQAGVTAHVATLGEPELRASLRDIEERSRAALSDLGDLLRAERGEGHPVPAASLPLSARVRELAQSAEAAGMRVTLERCEDLDTLPTVPGQGLFRIVQESVTNAIRHSGADTLRLSVTQGPGELTVTITDSGGPASRQLRAGTGIAGMRERAAQLGAELSIDQLPSGTTVSCRLPHTPALHSGGQP